MRVLRTVEELSSLARPVHWAMGFFDGVHLGHRRVIESASTPGALRGVLTFEQHPLTLLCPERSPRLLSPDNGYKAALLAELGVEVLLMLPFSRELSEMPPRGFLDWLADACPRGVAGMSMGANWRFGASGQGDVALLQAWARERSVAVCVQDLLMDGGDSVCSSRIRTLLQAGELAEAVRLLGHPFCACGVVEHGQHLARQLGFPTANITLPPHAALPPFGVYEVALELDGLRRRGVANLGLRPTINESHKPVRLEVHVLDSWSGDLYGRMLTVELCRFIRPERRFESLDALRAQLAQDMAAVQL